MTRQIAFYGIVLGIVALVACDGPPQAPTRLPPQAATPPGTAPNEKPPQTNPNSDPLAGLYTLTLNIGSGCAVIPEAERTRRYTANIVNSGGGIYVVTLSDATFLSGGICTAGSRHFAGIGCHQFFASEDIDTVQFFLENNNDEAHGGHIVERLPSGGWLEITGAANGKLNPSSMEASGTSNVWSCRTPSAYPYPCSSVVSCRSTDMRLTLTRK